MSFSVSRADGMLVFDMQYTGHRSPTDCHIHMGSVTGPALIGYDHIPPDMNPFKGFKLDLSNGNPQLPKGQDGKVLVGTWFSLEWSFSDGGDNETDPEHAEVQATMEDAAEMILKFIQMWQKQPK
jgi:hypothetical protein